MSINDIEKFYSKVIEDSTLIAKLKEGTFDTDRFIRNAVKEGKIHGYQFTEVEGKIWWQQNRQRAQNDHDNVLKSRDELSDMHVEAILSGKRLD